MMNCITRGLLLALGAGLLLTTAGAADPTPPAPAPMKHPLMGTSLAPGLRAAAERDGVSLVAQHHVGPVPVVGDSAVLWIGAIEGKRSEQWLLQLTRSALTAAERQKHPPNETKKYLSWGKTIVFNAEHEVLDLWLAGPVDVTAGPASRKAAELPRVRRSRVFVPGDYLRLGLDDSARVEAHVRRRAEEITREDPKFNLGPIYAMDDPIKPDQARWNKTVADRIGFTPELERAWIGGYVALQSFYNLANDVGDLRDIAEVALKKPSVLKLTKAAFGAQFKTYFGGPNTRVIDPAAVGLLPVGVESFDLPYSFGFDDDAIVTGGMVVTRPTPPLDVTAGILALIAAHPKEADRVVEVVVIAAQRGPATPAGSAAGRTTLTTGSSGAAR